jgi:hypothetical protein
MEPARFGANLLTLNREYRERLLDIEKERVTSGLDEESFTLKLLRKSQLQLIGRPKKTNANDGGVDFAIVFKGTVWVSQLKWWGKPVSNKQAKYIFGDLYLSETAMEAREREEKARYLLIAPFINKNTQYRATRIARHGYHLIWGENFVRFLSNPYFFFTHKMGVQND